MSLAGNSIKTHIIDPVYNRANFKSELRFEPNRIYHPNIRLINLGIEATTGGNQYLNGTGAYGVIKNIYLMDGNQVLDQLIDVGKFITFNNVNKSNTSNMSSRPNLAKSNVGNIFEGKDAGAGMTGAKIDACSIRNSSTGAIGGAVNNSQGWLNLKEVLPVLNAIGGNNPMKALNTNVFKNLKVVIEYNIDVNEYMKETNDTNSRTFEPQLIVDEFVGQNEVASNSGVGPINYASIEHDRANIGPVAAFTFQAGAADPSLPLPATNTQRTKLHISGFNNKSVGRMLIMKNPLSSDTNSYKVTANESNRYGKNQSMSYLNEELQVSIDGSSLFPHQGITRDAQRVRMLNESWGTCSLYPLSSSLAYACDHNDLRTNFILGGAKDYSVLDYYGFYVNGPIGDLQLDFKRDGCFMKELGRTNAQNLVSTPTLPNNLGIELNIYAEVNKSIVPSGNSYSVNYV